VETKKIKKCTIEQYSRVWYNSTNSFSVNITKIEIFDTFGKLLKRQILSKPSETVPINAFSNGIYIVKVFIDNGKIEIKKLVIK